MANPMQGLRVKPPYEQLIGVAVSDGLENIKLPNRDSSFLRNGFVMSQLDGEGARTMEKQQEIASKQAFQESLLKDIATNTGSNLSGLRSESHQELRTDRIREFTTPMRSRPETYDMTGGDDFSPFDTPSTPFYETPALIDYPNRINRIIYFDEQEQTQALSKQQNKREQTVQDVSQQLDQPQPIKRRIDVDTKALTKNYLDRVYLNTIDKMKDMGDLKNEFKRVGSHTPENPLVAEINQIMMEMILQDLVEDQEKNLKLIMELMTPQDQ